MYGMDEWTLKTPSLTMGCINWMLPTALALSMSIVRCPCASKAVECLYHWRNLSVCRSVSPSPSQNGSHSELYMTTTDY